MNPQQTELARRLVAHERWSDLEWRERGSSRPDNGLCIHWDHCDGCSRPLPDLSDATAGVLLGMWREATGNNGLAFEVVSSFGKHIGSSPAQYEATHMAELVASMLLDAWGAE